MRLPGAYKELHGLRVEHFRLLLLDIVNLQWGFLGQEASMEGINRQEGIAEAPIPQSSFFVFVISYHEELHVFN